jgi:hypothetical protein
MDLQTKRRAPTARLESALTSVQKKAHPPNNLECHSSWSCNLSHCALKYGQARAHDPVGGMLDGER